MDFIVVFLFLAMNSYLSTTQPSRSGVFIGNFE